MDYKDIKHDELVKKINEFTKLSRERDLTEEEALERKKIREEYIRRIRVNMTGQMENVVRVVKEDAGNSKKNN